MLSNTNSFRLFYFMLLTKSMQMRTFYVRVPCKYKCSDKSKLQLRRSGDRRVSLLLPAAPSPGQALMEKSSR